MCGLVGVAGFIGLNEEKALRNMLVFDTIRGEHSTGIASVKSNGEVDVCKEVGNPYNLFYSKDFIDTMKYFSRVLIGHNRWATMGKIDKNSAHPFDLGHIVGVHNGTLRNKHILDDSRFYDVDSENLYHHIQKFGARDAIKNLNGAWSLVWWDKRDTTLNFLRNEERPMWTCTSKDTRTLLWASEPWMLEAAAANNKIIITEPAPTKKDTHYSIVINDKGMMSKPVLTEVKSDYAPVKQSFNGGTAWHGQGKLPLNAQQSPHNSGKTLSLVPKQYKLSQLNASPLAPQFVQKYIGTKGITLEVCAVTTDNDGAEHLVLMDLNHPELAIRMYINKKESRVFKSGMLIKCDIGSFASKRGEGEFFKVTADSAAIVSEDEDVRYNDGYGNLLSKKNWEALYQKCGWCFDTLYAEDHGNRLTNTGDCVCGKCALITDVRTEFDLKSVY
jgi:hypothetical protein